MALATRIANLTDELITVIADVPDKNTPHFRRLKKFVEKALRYDTALRTNAFEVAGRLDGLQKKFQVVGNDRLADGLRSRLDELDAKRYRYGPDALSLLLELSDRPATFSTIGPAETPAEHPPTQEKVLTWADLGKPETFGADEEEGIWKDIDYTAETSDDSISLASTDVSIPRIIPHSSKTPADQYTPPEDLFLSVEDADLITRLQNACYYDDPSNGDYDGSIVFLTELESVREIIFMLQGLPTRLFNMRHDIVEPDCKFASRHLHHKTFTSALQSFSSAGTCTLRLRMFIRKHQHTPVMQTFQSELERHLSAFDKYLSTVHGENLKVVGGLRISMIQLLDDIHRECRFLRQLAEVVVNLEPHTVDDPFKCLNLMYDLVCSKQAFGEDEEFKLALALFMKCFEIYMKPIRLWMERGELSPSLDAFFSAGPKDGRDLRTLWHDWFILEKTTGLPNAPKFLRPAVRKIFTTGKSIVFLTHLGVVADNLPDVSTRSICDDILSNNESGSLLPFPGLLGNVIDRLVNDCHTAASSLLRTQLDKKCGLWISLQALEYVYLCKDLSRVAIIDSKFFDLIDRASQSWNDRFLLTELVQQVFADLPCIDPSRLIARSRKVARDEFTKRCRSVKILDALSIDFIFPWPVANIITKESLNSYQRLFTLLMQIRRPLFLLERQYLLRISANLCPEGYEEVKLAFGIRYRLLQFLNVLYSHITEVVISCSSAAVRKDLAEAVDFDAMVSVHMSYMSSLEDECLLSERASGIYEALISILDLSINFSDLVDSRLSRFRSGEVNQSSESAADDRHKSRHRRRKRHSEDDYPSDNDHEGAGDFQYDIGDEANVSTIAFHETHYEQRLRDIKTEFDRLCTSVCEGLRKVGRSGGQQKWEVLADKLAGKNG